MATPHCSIPCRTRCLPFSEQVFPVCSFFRAGCKSYIAFSLFLVCIFSQTATAATPQPANMVIGEAYDLTTGRLLYTETHRELGPKRWQVLYRADGGEMIAEKLVDSSGSSIQPSIVMKNFWSQELSVVGQADDGDSLRVEHGDAPLAAPDEARLGSAVTSTLDDSKRLALPFKQVKSNNTVVDAGFDSYVRRHWQTLMSDEKLNFYFMVPSRLTRLAMTIERTPCDTTDPSPELTMDEPVVCFRTQVKNFMVRLLVPPIDLTYGTNTKKLLRFQGLGNVADKNQKMMKVDIRYRYTLAER